MSRVPLPPVDAVVKNTACEYCSVGCGYKTYTWPLGREGGLAAEENAIGRDFPLGGGGGWPSALMHNVVRVDGELRNVLVLPDPDATVVNPGGDHSVRGGGLASRLYNPDSPTRDRLTQPQVRINGELVAIGWDAAIDIVAEVSAHVIATRGPLAWGMKRPSYGGHENAYVQTKLAWKAIGSPNHAAHHAPAAGDDAPGLTDAGIDAFSACYADDKAADVLLIVGTEPYENKTVRFVDWMAAGGATMIHIDPRTTFTSNFAKKNGGMHLPVQIGTDVALLGAIARYIIEQGWHDADFVRDYTADPSQIALEGSWRKRRFGLSYSQLVTELTSEVAFSLDGASQVTGIPVADIIRCAELLSGPLEPNAPRKKVCIYFEKGIMWSHNHEGTGALANLALLLGSVGRPGRAISRLGGHQRGGQTAGGYPLSASPHSFEGHNVPMDQDRWTVAGNTHFMWVIGTNWIGCSSGSGVLRDKLVSMTQASPHQPTSTNTAAIIATLKARVDAGGMVMVNQELYANETTALCDLVLPASGWGERTFARHNAERRLRLYERFCDPPGEAREDWVIVADVARRMGFEGFDWPDGNAVLEEAAEASRGKRLDFSTLVIGAQVKGLTSYELLRSYGTTGIQTPVDLLDGQLVSTERLHADLKFKGDSGKANFVKTSWTVVEQRYNALAPRGDQLWVTNMRVNHLWNNLSDSLRRPDAVARWPANCLQLNPEDAQRLGIASGDQLRIENSSLIDHLGNTRTGSFEAVAYVTDEVPPGLTCAYFLYPGSMPNSVVPADTTLQANNLRYNCKLGRGSITRLGRSPLADTMPFIPRNIV